MVVIICALGGGLYLCPVWWVSHPRVQWLRYHLELFAVLRHKHGTAYGRGVNLIFTRGHINLAVAFKGPNVLLELYKGNYSLTAKQELSAAAW